jgi:hypothetical protein
MKILKSIQGARVADPVRSKFAMVAPVLEATLHSLARDRIERLGGLKKITLRDVGREFRDGSGDAGICFEYAVHEAIATKNNLIYPLVSDVLEKFCKIQGGADSILFGPEKDGIIPILESVQDALTEDSIVYVGDKGRPPKLRKYIPQLIRAFRRNEARNKLPRSITGLWRADLFVGNKTGDQWVGTTVKINPIQLQGAKGLRIGIYPRKNAKDSPRKDPDLNLIRLPLPYDSEFMELFYKSFSLVRAFLTADGRVPGHVALPDAEDRYITEELEQRRRFPVLDVLEVVRKMAQPDLLESTAVENLQPNAALSVSRGLVKQPQLFPAADAVSVTPESTAATE